MSLIVDSDRAGVETCVWQPGMRYPGKVGVIVQSRHANDGWTPLSPTEARRFARDLLRKADEAEAVARGGVS